MLQMYLASINTERECRAFLSQVKSLLLYLFCLGELLFQSSMFHLAETDPNYTTKNKYI